MRANSPKSEQLLRVGFLSLLILTLTSWPHFGLSDDGQAAGFAEGDFHGVLWREVLTGFIFGGRGTRLTRASEGLKTSDEYISRVTRPSIA